MCKGLFRCLTIYKWLYHFSKDMMARLKNHVNTQYKNKERGTITYSSFKALAAHMWVVITRARKLRAEEETTMSLSVDCRERLVPPLQKFYFGNAILVQRVTTRAGELLSNAGIITAASLKNGRMDEEPQFNITPEHHEHH